MAGLGKEFYNIIISSIVGKVKNYGSKITFNNSLPIYGQYNLTGPAPDASQRTSQAIAQEKANKYPTYYTDLKQFEVDQQNAPAAELLKLNSKCYLGLLIDEPVYYSGAQTITINDVNYTNKYPAKYFTKNPTIATSFLEVHEVPNRSLGYFKNVDDNDYVYDPSKLFGGGYWSSYDRLCITKRQPDYKLSEVNSEYYSEQYKLTYKYVTYKVEDKFNDPVTDSLTLYDSIVHNSSINDYEPQIYLNNSQSLYIGENTNTKAWPAAKYFGLFNNEDYSAELRTEAQSVGQTEGKIHLLDNSLYYWGELTENKKWYHQYTGGSAEWSSKKSGLYELIDDNYVLTTDTTYNSSKTYYEKLGIIVKPSQGGIFGKEKFKIKWDSDIITNSLTI